MSGAEVAARDDVDEDQEELCSYCGAPIEHPGQACPARHDGLCSSEPAIAVDDEGFVALDTSRHLAGRAER